MYRGSRLLDMVEEVHMASGLFFKFFLDRPQF